MFSSNFSSISFSTFLAEEGIVWSKGGSFDLLDMEEELSLHWFQALIKASKRYEFTPRRYQGAAALFVSVPIITLIDGSIKSFPTDYYVHSQNPIGVENIKGLMESYIRSIT